MAINGGKAESKLKKLRFIRIKWLKIKTIITMFINESVHLKCLIL